MAPLPPFVSYYHDGDGTVIVETPDTDLIHLGKLWFRRRWHLDEAQFFRLRAENMDVEFRLVSRSPNATPPNTPNHRYVKIPCPTGKHKRSVVTFRNHTVAAMFCVHCERAWTEPTSRPELCDIPVDYVRG